jgi:hypothetical protein
MNNLFITHHAKKRLFERFPYMITEKNYRNHVEMAYNSREQLSPARLNKYLDERNWGKRIFFKQYRKKVFVFAEQGSIAQTKIILVTVYN